MKRGYLDVGDGHTLYFEDWGNPKAHPIMHLHGGPGSGFSARTKKLYNPKTQRVIFFDQRGAGKSTPHASTYKNTTAHLVADIEKVRTHLGIECMHVSGGSWGSTLALVYAIKHPERVTRLLLWGIYLARQFENDFVNGGCPRHFFPEAWERFIAPVPKAERRNGNAIMRFYAGKIRSKNRAVAKRFAEEWTLWECILMTFTYDPVKTLKFVKRDPDTLSVAVLETHYFLNKCFIPNNYILKNINKIKHIPCAVAHGYFDMCTPPVAAHELRRAYGKKLSLTWVKTGHYSSNSEMRATLRRLAKKHLTGPRLR